MHLILISEQCCTFYNTHILMKLFSTRVFLSGLELKLSHSGNKVLDNKISGGLSQQNIKCSWE